MILGIETDSLCKILEYAKANQKNLSKKVDIERYFELHTRDINVLYD